MLATCNPGIPIDPNAGNVQSGPREGTSNLYENTRGAQSAQSGPGGALLILMKTRVEPQARFVTPQVCLPRAKAEVVTLQVCRLGHYCPRRATDLGLILFGGHPAGHDDQHNDQRSTAGALPDPMSTWDEKSDIPWGYS